MKQTLFPLFLLSIILWGACKQNSALTKELEYADSLCCVEPEKAIVLLDSLGQDVQNADEHTQRLWQMLCIKAQDKADRPLTSDSIIKNVVAYFDKHGTPKEQVVAYYYLGRIYHELHDGPRAVKAYLKAIEISEKGGTPDAKIATNITSQLSKFYWDHQNPAAARDIALKGYEIASKHGILTPTLIMDVATSYNEMGIKDSTEYYYKLALGEISRLHAYNEYSGCISEICTYYTFKSNKERADQLMQLLNEIPKEYWQYNCIDNKTTYFEAFGPMDSAIHYNLLCMQDSSNWGSVSAASRSLMEIYRILGDYKASSYYAHIYSEANESIMTQLSIEQTRDANNEYKYYRDKEAEEEAYRQASEAKIRLLFVIAISLFCLLVGIAIYARYRIRMEQKLRQKDQEIKQKGKEVNHLIRRVSAIQAKALPERVLNRFKNAATGKATAPTEDDWDALAASIEQIYPEFTANVLNRCPLIKPEELHVVYLMRAGFNNAEIVNITETSKSTGYRKIRDAGKELSDLLEQ